MPVQVLMPQLGESVLEGTITRWLKGAGEPVEQYEPLLEVNTDKVDTEIPSPGTGILLEILIPEGTAAPVRMEGASWTTVPAWTFGREAAERALLDQFRVGTLSGFDLAGTPSTPALLGMGM